tara:strand:- start:631 stop:810 length:180 start_codon:yes stop_codon:yes gene_type:complete
MGKNKPEVFKGRTKEWDENQWQGRSKHQVETNYKLMDITVVMGIISFIGIMIYRLITTM